MICFGLSTAYYYMTNVMVENGHFCNQYEPYIHNNITFTKIRVCQDGIAPQTDRASIFMMISLLIGAVPCIIWGFFVDRFRVLFVRLVSNFSMCIGLLCIAMTNFNNEWILYLASLFIGISNGIVGVQMARDLPLAVEALNTYTRSLLNGIWMAGGFSYWLISKYFLLQKKRFTQDDYFWSVQNFSFVMIGVYGSLTFTRTFIWLKGVYGGQKENKQDRNAHFQRRSVFQDEQEEESQPTRVTQPKKRLSKVAYPDASGKRSSVVSVVSSLESSDDELEVTYGANRFSSRSEELTKKEPRKLQVAKKIAEFFKNLMQRDGNFRTSIVHMVKKRASLYSVTSNVRKRASRVSKRASQIVDYRPANDTNSLWPLLKTLKFWSIIFWLGSNISPYFCLSPYFNKLLIEKGLSKPEMDSVFSLTGWLNLSILVLALVYGSIFDIMSLRIGFKRSWLYLLFCFLQNIPNCLIVLDFS